MGAFLRHSKEQFGGARAARGAALVEFAIALPLIMLFMVGVYDLGRAESQINTLAQVAYQVAFIGATIQSNGRRHDGIRAGKVLGLVQNQTNYFDTVPILTLRPIVAPQTRYFTGTDGNLYVTATVQGTLRSFYRVLLPTLFTMQVSVTAPYLYTSTSSLAGTIDGFQNGTDPNGNPSYSQCNGNFFGSSPYETDCTTGNLCGCESSGGLCIGTKSPPICPS